MGAHCELGDCGAAGFFNEGGQVVGRFRGGGVLGEREARRGGIVGSVAEHDGYRGGLRCFSGDEGRVGDETKGELVTVTDGSVLDEGALLLSWCVGDEHGLVGRQQCGVFIRGCQLGDEGAPVAG